MTQTLKINEKILPIEQKNNQLLVDARLLHQQLHVETRYDTWIGRRIEEYEFVENEDYFNENSQCSNLSVDKNNHGQNCPRTKLSTGRKKDGTFAKTKNYLLTLDMAKELAMVEKNKIARQVRKYFIAAEKQYRDWLGFVFPRLERHKTLFTEGEYYDYIHLLKTCGCSVISASVRRRMRNHSTEFMRAQDGLILVSETYGRTIVANAITRKLNFEMSQRKMLPQ